MPIKKGTTSIGKVYVGNKEIDRIYKGSTLVYQNILLPREYQQVEYIESTGTQYIDTGYKPSDNIKVKCDFQPLVSSSIAIFGSYYPFFYLSLSGALQKYAFDIATGQTSSSRIQLADLDTNRHTIDVDYIAQKITFDTSDFNFTKRLLTYTYNIFLFCVNDNGSSVLKARMKLYSCKIYDNNALVRNYVPCYRKIDGVAGLYDLVNGVFYTNAGTGEFICGHPILSNDYDLLEYIESSGTQYIDTGYVPTNNSKSICEVSFIDTTTQQLSGLYSNDNFRFQFGVLGSTIPRQFYEGLGNKSQYFSLQIDNAKHLFILNAPNKSLSIDSETYTYTNITIGTNQYDFCLFARINGSSGVDLNYACSMKLYSCRIYDNNEIVRDYVPAVRLADNTIGLYDIKNDVFYTNAGSGTFVAGPYVFFPHALQEVEYIESSGTQYIDSGIKGTQNIDIEFGFEMVDTTSIQYLFGACLTFNTNALQLSFNYNNYKNYRMFYGNPNSNYGNVIGISFSDKITVNKCLITNNKIMLDNEEYQYEYPYGNPFTTPNNMTIFARNNNGAIDYYASYKLKYFKIYDNDVLVRDFVPCYHKKTNVIGLFDKVTGVFYTNAGTGTFTKGDNV